MTAVECIAFGFCRFSTGRRVLGWRMERKVAPIDRLRDDTYGMDESRSEQASTLASLMGIV